MAKKVYCPECASEIYTYDGYSTTDVVIRCGRCKRYIKFKPIGGATITIKNPEIKTASGARFW